MAPESAHEPPNDATGVDPLSPTAMVWSGLAVFGSATVGGLLGLGIGAALGWFVPGYYRSVYAHGHDPNFDPLAVGIGQGLTQGVVVGGIIGLVLVLVFNWYRLRSGRTDVGKPVGR